MQEMRIDAFQSQSIFGNNQWNDLLLMVISVYDVSGIYSGRLMAWIWALCDAHCKIAFGVP